MKLWCKLQFGIDLERYQKAKQRYCFLKEVFLIITTQMSLLTKLQTEQYQEMAIITLIKQYFLSIIKVEQFILILTVKFYLKHVLFTTIVPQIMVDHSLLKIQIVS